jgi:soluble lytic murein transglycosylase
MQLMWGTAREVARQVRVAVGEPDTLYRPDVNLRLGSHYLAWLERRYEHKEFAIAAYNAGPGNIDRWQKLFGDLPMDVFCELIPFAETRDYVQRVMGYKRGYEMTGKATAAN